MTNEPLKPRIKAEPIIIAWIVLIALGLLTAISGCSPKADDEQTRSSLGSFDVITIEGCQYIEYDSGVADSRVYSLTHKGNCNNKIHSK